MGNLWEISRDTEGMRGFTRDLGSDIESLLKETITEPNYDTEVNYYGLDRNSGYMLIWNYKDKHFGEIMITRNKEDDSSLFIERFWGIKPAGTSRGIRSSSPSELRKAAQIYEEIDQLLDTKYGKPPLNRDGTPVYVATLEETVSV